VNHAHFLVNGKKVDIPSYSVRPGDVVTVKERSLEILPIQHAVDTVGRSVPDWLNVDAGDRKIIVDTLPAREQIDTEIKEQLIVELYSK
jgi:small subunit ribosomal protein S4